MINKHKELYKIKTLKYRKHDKNCKSHKITISSTTVQQTVVKKQ